MAVNYLEFIASFTLSPHTHLLLITNAIITKRAGYFRTNNLRSPKLRKLCPQIKNPYARTIRVKFTNSFSSAGIIQSVFTEVLTPSATPDPPKPNAISLPTAGRHLAKVESGLKGLLLLSKTLRPFYDLPYFLIY